MTAGYVAILQQLNGRQLRRCSEDALQSELARVRGHLQAMHGTLRQLRDVCKVVAKVEAPTTGTIDAPPQLHQLNQRLAHRLRALEAPPIVKAESGLNTHGEDECVMIKVESSHTATKTRRAYPRLRTVRQAPALRQRQPEEEPSVPPKRRRGRPRLQRVAAPVVKPEPSPVKDEVDVSSCTSSRQLRAQRRRPLTLGDLQKGAEGLRASATRIGALELDKRRHVDPAALVAQASELLGNLTAFDDSSALAERGMRSSLLKIRDALSVAVSTLALQIHASPGAAGHVVALARAIEAATERHRGLVKHLAEPRDALAEVEFMLLLTPRR